MSQFHCIHSDLSKELIQLYKEQMELILEINKLNLRLNNKLMTNRLRNNLLQNRENIHELNNTIGKRINYVCDHTAKLKDGVIILENERRSLIAEEKKEKKEKEKKEKNDIKKTLPINNNFYNLF